MITKEKIEKLNEYQKSGRFHPYTCCSYNGCERSENNWGVLVATDEKWICPCGKYTQEYDDSVDLFINVNNTPDPFDSYREKNKN